MFPEKVAFLLVLKPRVAGRKVRRFRSLMTNFHIPSTARTSKGNARHGVSEAVAFHRQAYLGPRSEGLPFVGLECEVGCPELIGWKVFSADSARKLGDGSCTRIVAEFPADARPGNRRLVPLPVILCEVVCLQNRSCKRT
jgi:hypothetical protein